METSTVEELIVLKKQELYEGLIDRFEELEGTHMDIDSEVTTFRLGARETITIKHLVSIIHILKKFDTDVDKYNKIFVFENSGDFKHFLDKGEMKPLISYSLMGFDSDGKDVANQTLMQPYNKEEIISKVVGEMLDN